MNCANIVIGFLLCFSFVRPLSLVLYDVKIGPFNFLEVFTITSSILICIVVLCRIQKLKLDSVNILIVMYCCYCALSLLWGSDYRETFRMVIPYCMFFVGRLFVQNDKQLWLMLTATAFGYVIPIIGSAYIIAAGLDKGFEIYQTGGIKAKGLFYQPHPFGHAMLLFTYIYALLIIQLQQNKLNVLRVVLGSLFALSVYCLIKSGVRTVYIGFTVFWLIFLWNFQKKYLLIFMLCLTSVAALKTDKLEAIFYQQSVVKKIDVNAAGSGRLVLWKHNWQYFKDSRIDQQIIGNGIGSEGGPGGFKSNIIVAAHNDYLSLLMMLGIIGLLLYLGLLCAVFKKVIVLKLDKETKGMYCGMLIAVIIMNYLSNSYLLRIELAQMFWFLLGILFCLNDKKYVPVTSINYMETVKC